MKTLTTIGIDLAKNSFSVCGVDAKGKRILQRTLSRSSVVPFFANLPECMVGMEVCASSEYWARTIESLGHTVRRIHPRYVKAYLLGAKNDANDAAAICEAVQQPNKRLMQIPGIGVMTATVLLTRAGVASNFRNGREFTAFLGLVPRQNSTGGKTKLFGISKHGDKNIRTLLVHGARAVVRSVACPNPSP